MVLLLEMDEQRLRVARVVAVQRGERQVDCGVAEFIEVCATPLGVLVAHGDEERPRIFGGFAAFALERPGPTQDR